METGSGLQRFRACPVRAVSPFIRHAAARSALSIEGWDFEEEKSLDQRQRGFGSCRRAGRLWQHLLFCRPRVAAQRADQPRHDRDPEPRRPGQGRARRSLTPTTTPQRLQRQARLLFHRRLRRRTAHHHPEHARGAVRRGLRLRRRQLYSRSTTQTKRPRVRVSGLNGLSSSIFITRNGTLRLCRQPGSARVHGREPRRHGSSYPLSLPGVYRVSVNPGGSVALAFVAELELRLLSAPAYRSPDAQLLRRPLHLAQGRGGLRAAECAQLVPVSDAEPRPASTRPATTTALRWSSTGPSRPSSRPTAARPTC